MAIIRTFTGNGLPDEPLTTSTAGSGDTPFNIVNGDWAIDNTEGARPPAIRLTKESGVAPNVHWTSLGTLANAAGRTYIKLSGPPSGTVVAISAIDAADARLFDLALLTTSRLRLHDAANAQIGSLPIMDLNVWYRVEWTLTPAQVVVYLYQGESTTALGSVTWNGTIPALNRYRVALNSSTVTIDPLWVDDLAISDTADLIGPAGTEPVTTPFKTWDGTQYVDLEAYFWNGTSYTGLVTATP